MNYEQKIETYFNLSKNNLNSTIENQLKLGWEVVSTNSNQNNGNNVITIAYKRDKSLKMYNRLSDIEDKIKKIEKNILAINKAIVINNENEVEKSKRYTRYKKLLKYPFTFLYTIFVLFLIFAITIEEIRASFILQSIVIAIAIGLLHYLHYWLNRKSKDIKDNPFLKTKKSEAYLNIEYFYEEAKNTNKLKVEDI